MHHHELDIRRALLNHMDLLQIELDRLQEMIATFSGSLSHSDELWKIHQSVSNITTTMKIDLQNSDL